MPARKVLAPATDPLAAYDALASEPAALTDGAERCMLPGCNGIAKKGYVFTFTGTDGNEHRLGVCFNGKRHVALRNKGAFTKADHDRAMRVLDDAIAQNS